MTVAGWFKSHGLPWDKPKEDSLKLIGVLCVEHLKLLKRSEWDRLFSGDSPIFRRMASQAYDDLKAQSFDSKKVVEEIPARHDVLVDRVARYQQPHEDVATGEMMAAIDDDVMWNFDHVPTWYETIGNYSWGPKDSGRRNIKTGGKEKSRYTTVLCIAKSGKKARPFITFKGIYVDFVQLYLPFLTILSFL